MSGACADCGGPDYQTLEARIAELEALHDKAINRETEAKRERNELRDQLEQAVAERDAPLLTRVAELEAKVQWYAGVVMDYTAVLERAEQAEAELAERDRMLRLAADKHVGRCPCGDHDQDRVDYLADLRARAEEGSGK